ncbi:3-oxoacyl-[acyl-carrier-protein] synthase III C-terminal domain-containing protein [Kineosporia sp. NBRC 101731]|uniref:3-oxoacyl-[acyl-carrier-protein] synthase III C-terminal domain-containing protein n=1 Tax=Kineosporia sp. NBRC 101731 TaxID=3032199 RepID=UPI00249FAC71|nr:3-oxoacyl-[acyl-carrier-protein] synthase III C-terminal domain-containing protein [Kineosporia sp. NBRC 101731]GLY32463.1 3-oxoacyl-ACP synthase [Kineosporia sp. NBRC 101731]
MITLESVEFHVPERVVTVADRAQELGLSAEQIHMFGRVHGLDRMHYDPDVSLLDLMVPAARAALGDTDPRSIRYVIYGHAMHGTADARAGIAGQVRQVLGLNGAQVISLTQQNCAISLSAIDVAGTLLRAGGDPLARALVVTGDKPVSPDAKLVMNSCIVADGAAACLVAWNGTGVPVTSFATRTTGEHYRGMLTNAAGFRAAAAARPGAMAAAIEGALAGAGCTMDDIQVIIPPNPNVVYWNDTITSDAVREKFFFDNIPRYSHALAADVFINYVTLRDDKRLEPGRPLMFVAIGVGMTFSAMVLVPGAEQGKI